jgi:hypothetical protein
VATTAQRPTRFSRESKATAVDIDQARAEVGRRIEKGTEQGKSFLRVVVPTPREPVFAAMKTSPPDAVLAPEPVAGLAWDEHGGKPLLLATRFIF